MLTTVSACGVVGFHPATFYGFSCACGDLVATVYHYAWACPRHILDSPRCCSRHTGGLVFAGAPCGTGLALLATRSNADGSGAGADGHCVHRLLFFNS